MNPRVKSIANSLAARGIDGLIVSNLTNVRYLTGFEGTSGYVVLTPKGGWFLTDPRYKLQARESIKG